MRLLCLTENSLLLSMRINTGGVENIRESIPEDVSFPLYNKVDLGCYSVNCDLESGDIYIVGDDRWLKKYDMPKMKYDEINFETPPKPPLEEFKSHGIGTNCFDFSSEADFIVSGGQDGALILRNRKKLNQLNEIKAHAIFNGGVTALCFSRVRTTLYSAGGDGTFLVWPVGSNPNPNQAIEPADFFSSPDLSNIPQVENTDDESVAFYKDLLEEQFLESEVTRKEEFKSYLSKELKNLQNKLYSLLEDNKKAQDIEQLEREEFVIDLDRKTKLEFTGDAERESIRKEAQRKELEYECLRDRIKNETWDTMKTHSTAVISLDSDQKLYNYGVRSKTEAEQRKLKQVLQFRRMELREKITGLENDLDTILDQSEFSKGQEKYIMDRERGEQTYEKDEALPIVMEEFVFSTTKKEEKKTIESTDLTGKKGRRPVIDLNQFRLGANKPDIMDDDDFDEKMRERGAQRDRSAIEELRWKIITKKKDLEETKKNLHQIDAWQCIYEPFELYTDSRKRMQIEMLQDIVFSLKESFNKEFEEFQIFKENKIMQIQEKNQRIQEILTDLKKNKELFAPKTSLSENPDHILAIKPDEISVEKFLTVEERAAEDAKRNDEAERLKRLEGDNVGQRGIKIMLGGTLEMKKNKGIMEETLDREEWMEKPVEEMSEEEKLKLKEFEQKEKELQDEKEKKRKAWEQELKKLGIEIEEACDKFEEELKTLHKKRLFYDMRIYEQELSIIRLTLMLHENKEIKEEKLLVEANKNKLEEELEDSRFTITRFTELYEDFDTRYKENTAINDQEKSLKQKFTVTASHRAILNFIRNGGKSANKAQTFGVNQEKNAKEQEMLNTICELDPYGVIDINLIKKRFVDENSKEHYTYERDNIQNLSSSEFDMLVEERMNRVEMNKQKDEMEQEINHIRDHKNF